MFSRGPISEGEAIFPRKYGPQGGGANLGGGQISWDTGTHHLPIWILLSSMTITSLKFFNVFLCQSHYARTRYVLCYIECKWKSLILVGYNCATASCFALLSRNHCRDIWHINVVNSQAEERFIIITFGQTSNIIHVCRRGSRLMQLMRVHQSKFSHGRELSTFY
jgi:hypothetical protein